MAGASSGLLERLDDIPPLPQSITELGKIIENPNSTPLHLARVVERDTALAARVMRLVNSAFYAVSGGVETLERAVCLLGYSTIHQLALCLQSLQILGELGSPPPRALMQHAQQTAVAAQLLAERLLVPQPSRLFVAGLLHDMGRLALFCLQPEAAGRWSELAAGSVDRLAVEVELFGIDHQRAGRLLSEKWKYPRPLQLVIAGHHAPRQLPEGEDGRLCRVVALADNWLRQAELCPLPGVEQAPRPELAGALGLPEKPDESFGETLEIRLGEVTGWLM